MSGSQMPKALATITVLLGIAMVLFGDPKYIADPFAKWIEAIGLGLIGAGIGGCIVTYFMVKKKINADSVNHKNIQQSIKVHNQFADISVTEIIKSAKYRLYFFTMSGRNIISPRVKEQFTQIIKDNSRNIKIKFLCLNRYGDHQYVKQRIDMMSNTIRFRDYNKDFGMSRDITREITNADPAHDVFDIRFYNMLPTTFFIICDERLYISFQLSTPVASCPVIELDGSVHMRVKKVFEDHFDFYWEKSYSFVCVIGIFEETGNFLMIKSRRRTKWEWPAGYIEPNEKPEESAKREFKEETGYEIGELQKIEETVLGIYFRGVIGEKTGGPADREVEEILEFAELPPAEDLSFPDERDFFQGMIDSLQLQKVSKPS